MNRNVAMEIADNIRNLKSTLGENVSLVAVSKTKPVSDIMEAYNAGQRIFGENKVQEMVAKRDLLPNDIQWHFIGHLQTNKIKYMAPFVSLIHSVDSEKLLVSISKEAEKNNRVIDCLLQIKIASEQTKFGMSPQDAQALLASGIQNKLSFVNIKGVMGMASFVDDENQVAAEFALLKKTFDNLKSGFFAHSSDFNVVSMGMSDDYQIAITQGSNMVRIGSLVFGERHYE
jgi:PLP dependent protein